MSDGVTYLGLAVAFGFIFVAGMRLGTEPRDLLGGLFPARGVRDWPTGVQEADAPRFDIAHLDALRPGHPNPIDASATWDGVALEVGPPELIDLGSHRLQPPRR